MRAKGEGKTLDDNGSWEESHGACLDEAGPKQEKRLASQGMVGFMDEVVQEGSVAPLPWEQKLSSAEKSFPLGRRFLFWHLWVPLGIFAALVLVFETTDLDLKLSDLFFDFHERVFFWKNTWWATSLIHSGGKLLVAAVWVCLLSLFLFSFLGKGLSKLGTWRAALLFIMMGMISGPVTVGCLKMVVNRPYPEHIKRYGGPLEYKKLFQGPPPTNRHYKGFPAGHASAGYGLMSLYFVLRERRPKLAPWGLVLGLALGTLFGFGQHVRGLHYASHNAWSAAICWFEALALYVWVFRGRLAVEGSLPLADRFLKIGSL